VSKRTYGNPELWIAVCLAILTLVLYAQTVNFDFTSFDDDKYAQENPAVRIGVRSQTVLWALRANYMANWHPLTWISLMADTDAATIANWVFDISLGRQNSGFHHLGNIVLHAANAVLLFIVLNVMTGRRWPSAFTAALFAVHPLHVESVAWISERKDVLSTLFWLLTMLAYFHYVRKPGPNSYLWVLVAYALGLMSKAMLVSLPIVLLLLDFWPLRRDVRPFRRLVFEKVPLFVMAAFTCVLTVWAQKSGGAVASITAYPLGVRLANAAVAYFAYLWKMLWPVGLSILYIHPGRSLPMWQVVGSAIGLVAVTAAAVRLARSRPYVTVGWLWYLITLVPVIGIVQVGKQAMADRYTYIPLIGIFVVVAWGVPSLLGIASERPSRVRSIALAIAACAVVAVLAVMTYARVGIWRNNLTLFSSTLEVDPTNSFAHCGLGTELLHQGDTEGGIRHLRMALKYHPEYTDARYNLAEAYREAGRIDEAIAEYKRVIRQCPWYAQAHNNLGGIYAMQGKYDLAIAEFKAALKADPASRSARDNLRKAQRAKAGEL